MAEEVKTFYDAMGPYYDRFMGEGESTLEDELVLVKVTFPLPCKILDVGCGTGRLSLPLQDEGYHVVGLDISEGMIEQARKKGLKMTHIGDFVDFEYEEESFDGIISLHTGFSYTNDEEVMKSMIKKCRALLGSSGIVLWDTPNEDFYGKERILKWPAGEKFVETLCYGHNAEMLKQFFKELGFDVREVWGSYTPLQEFTNSLPRIIIEAEKQGLII